MEEIKNTSSSFPKVLQSVATFSALILCVFVLSVFSIDNSCYWGDDHAAYLSQGIAIAEGRLQEQTALNARMHPAPLPQEAQNGELVYVWGYPLLLSLVYRLSGFDRVAYSNVVLYKLPSVLALALLAGLLYLFYRRRIGGRLSFFLALLFCTCIEFFSFLNTLYSDLVFLFFVVLSLELCERFLLTEKSEHRSLLAVAFGITLWYMYEVRLNGVSVLFLCILLHLSALRPKIKELSIRSVLVECLPYAIFLLLVFVSHHMLAKATSNTTDLGSDMSFALFRTTFLAYLSLIRHWFGLLWNSILLNPLYSVLHRLLPFHFSQLKPLQELLVGMSLFFTLWGMLFSHKEQRMYSLFVLLYLIITSLLPYTQGLRYIYPILPLLLLLAVQGLIGSISLIGKHFPLAKHGKNASLFTWPVLLLGCLLLIYPHISSVMAGEKGIRPVDVISAPSDVYMQNSYSPCAIEVYNYIQQETGNDSIIAFFAPRALYLNTQRLSIRPGVNGHSLAEADYCLRYLKCGDFPLDTVPGPDFTICFENEEFVLYQRIQDEAIHTSA